MAAKKILYLVRHAKAGNFASDLPDIDRPLTETGVNESYKVAKQLHSERKIPDLIISSTGARAISTALIFQRILKVSDEKVRVADVLFEIEPMELLKFINRLDDTCGAVMLFGHNPAFSQFAAMMESSIQHMPTASVAMFNFDVQTWKEVSFLNSEPGMFFVP